MKSFMIILCVSAMASAHPPAYRRAHHARQYYPDVYPLSAAVYNIEPHYTAPIASQVHYTERYQPAFESVHHAAAPLPVTSVVQTAARSAAYPTYTHSQTKVHVDSGSIYHVSVPVTYSQTLQSPTEHRTYEYNTVHASPSTGYNAVHSYPSTGYNTVHASPSTGYNAVHSYPSTGYNTVHSYPSTGYNTVHSYPSTGYNTVHASPSAGYQRYINGVWC